MEKLPRRAISNLRSRAPHQPLPTAQPRYRPQRRPPSSTVSQPSDIQTLVIVCAALGTVALFILATQYTWAQWVLGIIILAIFIAYCLTGIMNG